MEAIQYAYRRAGNKLNKEFYSRFSCKKRTHVYRNNLRKHIVSYILQQIYNLYR